MTAVIGVDGATKNLGLALGEGTLVTLNGRAKADDSVRRLYELGRAFRGALKTYPPLPDLVMVEGYGLGTPGRLALVRLGEVGGMIRTTAFEFGAEVVEVAPAALKRFATGNGAAKKPAMVERALELGARFSRPLDGNEKHDPHDEADAFLLRRLGLIGAGLIAHETDYELEVAASLRWPNLSRRPQQPRRKP